MNIFCRRCLEDGTIAQSQVKIRDKINENEVDLSSLKVC